MTDLEDLGKQVQRTNRLLALQLIRGLPLAEQVTALSFAGFEPREIAPIVKKTPNHVSVILSRERKRVAKEIDADQDAEGTSGEAQGEDRSSAQRTLPETG